jgi:hypothetical protein
MIRRLSDWGWAVERFAHRRRVAILCALFVSEVGLRIVETFTTGPTLPDELPGTVVAIVLSIVSQIVYVLAILTLPRQSLLSRDGPSVPRPVPPPRGR